MILPVPFPPSFCRWTARSRAWKPSVRERPWLQEWIDCQPHLTLLHVIDFLKVSASLDAGTTYLVKQGEEYLSAGRQILEEAGLEGLFTEKLLVGQPSRLIAEEAEEGHHALILMGARGLSSLKKLLLGSVSSDVLHRVPRVIIGIVYR